jgi:hypothetical protein
MNIQCSNPVWERASQKGATLRLLAIAGYAGPSGSARPMVHVCFRIMFTPTTVDTMVFYPLLAYFNRNLPATSPHVPPLFPNFFSTPPPWYVRTIAIYSPSWSTADHQISLSRDAPVGGNLVLAETGHLW